jgi:multiple sugar transport system permease protein
MSLLKGRESSKQLFLFTAVTPMLLYMLVFSLLPTIWAFVLSLYDYSPQRVGSGFLGLGGENPFVGLQNFQNMIS